MLDVPASAQGEHLEGEAFQPLQHAHRHRRLLTGTLVALYVGLTIGLESLVGLLPSKHLNR